MSSGCPFGYTSGSAPHPLPPNSSNAAAGSAPSSSASSTKPVAGEVSENLPPVKEQYADKLTEDKQEGRPNVYYSDYLQLDKILNSQHPVSWEKGKHCHDEHLFIVVHQAYEIWFKQILVELDSLIDLFMAPVIGDADLSVAISRLSRVVEIMKLLVEQIRIIETMQPQDFLEFREFLYPASGFQSFQFRLFENKLGLFADRTYQNKPVYYYLAPNHQEAIKKGLERPTLLELVQRWLERTPFLEIGDFNFWKSYERAVNDMLARDREVVLKNPLISENARKTELESLQATAENFATILDPVAHTEQVKQGRRKLSHKATLGALLVFLYREEPLLQQPHRFLSLLCDVDEHLQMWRSRHMMMAHRMIGTKIGTGGSSGYGYLQKTTRTESYRAFSDLFNLSTFLLPRSSLPKLPDHVRENLQFRYTLSANADGSKSAAAPSEKK